MNKKNIAKIIFSLLFSSAFLWAPLVLAQTENNAAGGDSVLDLNQKIQQNKDRLKALQQQSDAMTKKIREAQKKSISLKNQINIIDAGIDETQIDIQTKELEVEQIELELELAQEQIAQENQRLDETKNKITDILKQINSYDLQKSLVVLINYSSFSELYDELHRGEILNNSLLDQMRTVQKIKSDLEENQKSLNEKKDSALDVKSQLNEKKITLEEEKNLKQRLFGNSQATEAEFQKTLTSLRAEEASLDSEIVTLERNFRKNLQLTDENAGNKLSWPINPSRGISAYFHDQDYPFRYIFEHTGMDIRAYQGTPVTAAAGGYVAAVYNGGYGNKPSYVMILHANNVSTVYQHLSSINISPNTYVTRGQIIGASGGVPGTAGAGRWTTGPHLHFEVRLNGVPVDPLSYLP